MLTKEQILEAKVAEELDLEQHLDYRASREARGICVYKSDDEWESTRRTVIAVLDAYERVRELAEDWRKRAGTANHGEVLLDCGYNQAWADCLRALDAAMAGEV